MNKLAIIYLVSETPQIDAEGNPVTDEFGQPVVAENRKKVYAEKESVRQSEFYQAQANGLKPEIVFSIWEHDFSNQLHLLYNSEKYTVLRVADTTKGRLKLVCYKVVE